MSNGGGPLSTAFSEADLHAFADGRLDPVRQIEMTRRLRSHSADRARVEAWRDQNELIRATFSEVENETMPVSLSILPPARLRCVVNDIASTGNAALPVQGPVLESLSRHRSRSHRSRMLGLAAVTICAALTAGWIMLAEPQADSARTVKDIDSGTQLATRVASTLTQLPPAGTGRNTALPPANIPNLAAAGFDLIDVTSDTSAIPALLLIYQDKDGQRLVLGIAKTAPGPAEPHPNASLAIVWQRDGRSFALTGTPRQSRLDEIAALLQRL